jgi:hypothetical protein
MPLDLIRWIARDIVARCQPTGEIGEFELDARWRNSRPRKKKALRRFRRRASLWKKSGRLDGVRTFYGWCRGLGYGLEEADRERRDKLLGTLWVPILLA